MKKNSTKKWTQRKIKKGFELFYSRHNRYPTALEIDKFYALPSSRNIQRYFGGIRKFRSTLGIKITDHTKGKSRSKVARYINKRATQMEMEVNHDLIERFGKPYVHTEESVIPGKKFRLDFFVYAKDYEFGIDVFYPKDLNSLKGSLNYKFKKYTTASRLKNDVFLVSTNNEISNWAFKKAVRSVKNRAPKRLHILTLQELIKKISKLEKVT